MDKKISPEMVQRRKRKRALQLLLTLAASAAGLYLLVSMFSSGVSRDTLSTSVVDKGAIEITVSATGTVLSLSNEIITSPVSSKILEVYKKVGDHVSKGEAILRLDLDAVNIEMGRMKNELTMKRLKMGEQQVVAESALSDLLMQIEVDGMRIKQMEHLLASEKYLDSIGVGTQLKIKQAELDFAVEKMKFEQLKTKYENQKRSMVAEAQVSELDYQIAQSAFDLKNKQVFEAQVRAPQAATLTWVNDQVGTSTSEGAQLAVIADLSRFKVDAEISDRVGNRVTTGSRVIVQVLNRELRGTIGNVVPSSANGLINFTVLLEENNHEVLRSGLKVDVHIVSAVSRDVLRVENRSYYAGAGEYELWVVEGSKAVKRKVQLGESSYSHVEVKAGLKEGETVVVSDMNQYAEEQSLIIRD